MTYFNAPSARRTDLDTSHQAAHDTSFKASKHRLMALRTLHKYGPLIDHELSGYTGLQHNSIGKRRKDCQDAGLVDFYYNEAGERLKRSAPSGSLAYLWTITEEGIEFLKAYDAENK